MMRMPRISHYCIYIKSQGWLYDTLSTAVYPTLTLKMAMKIGSQYKFSEVWAGHVSY